MQPLAVDVREASYLSSLSTSTIRRYIRSGQLKAIRLGRRVVVSLESLEKLVREGPSPLNSVNGQTSTAISSCPQDSLNPGPIQRVAQVLPFATLRDRMS
jgi:excisionase family DNA binding protein